MVANCEAERISRVTCHTEPAQRQETCSETGSGSAQKKVSECDAPMQTEYRGRKGVALPRQHSFFWVLMS